MTTATEIVEPPLMEDEEKEEKKFLIKIKFRGSGKIYDYYAGNLNFEVGDLCIVEGKKGKEFAVVTMSKRTALLGCRKKQYKKIIRKANSDDLERLRRNELLEKEALLFCQERIQEREISMKLSRVEFDFVAEKATFFFCAEGRVDFRDLVKDVAQKYKIKVEMWQVGVRDEARIAGGCGSCGKGLCCTTFLKDFEPVSIKMAKTQGLALNPIKISGVCGRLMCCLGYENKVYCELKKTTPNIGKVIKTPEGNGKVIKVNILLEKILVELEDARQVVFNICDLPKDPIVTVNPHPGKQSVKKNQNQRVSGGGRKEKKGNQNEGKNEDPRPVKKERPS